MSRIPPNLSYLTIYNPTLRPSTAVEDDDAEEQAHILFYTSKERAVSRDRMLRQIGLAKALVNFAELFNPNDLCNNVHSQSKRMVMVSPEPNFWIHAGIELARVPKAHTSNGKAKEKARSPDKGKEKAISPTYDFEDGSVHDGALLAHILQGYERFKLTHGSFTSILSSLGQQALELQLERFWTVWAWSWDLEDVPDFGEGFGLSLHPHFSQLIPLVDQFSDALSQDMTPVILFRPYIIPSTRYNEAHYPAALAAHLLTLIPPPVLDSSPSSDTVNTLASSVDTIRGLGPNGRHASNPDSGTFLGMSAVNMDVRKWGWPGYLSFGKGATKNGSLPAKSINPGADNENNPFPLPEKAQQEVPYVEVDVNHSALEDAISSESLSLATREPGHGPGAPERHSTSRDLSHEDTDAVKNDMGLEAKLSSSPNPSILKDLPPPPPPPPEFSFTRLHLAPHDDPTSTSQVTVHYLIRNQLMLALINLHEGLSQGSDTEAADLRAASEGILNLFDSIETRTHEEGLKCVSNSVPSATKILQPQDRYVISTGQYTVSSPAFVSKSSHLFNAKGVLDADLEINEVFSRGQNPQHWHISKRGYSSNGDDTSSTVGQAVYLEVFRKETSLTDVDNVLAGVVRKLGLAEAKDYGLGT